MNYYAYMAQLEERNEPFAIATIVDATNNCPGRTSFKMIVTRDGKVFGSIGGGGIEYQTRNTALEMLRTGERTRIVEHHLTTEPGGNGMACGGDAQVFIETVIPQPQLFIFGGGHIGTALTRYATDVGFAVTVIDNRPEFASKERHPQAADVWCKSYDDIATTDFPQNAYFVIVTHQHIGDEICLRGLLSQPNLTPKYLGCIGSAVKLSRVFREIIDSGISADALETVRSPIGIDNGGVSASEIAISIIAEIIAARYNKPLQDAMCVKKHPLHIDPNTPKS